MEFTPEQLARLANSFRSSLFQRPQLYFYLLPGEKRVASRRVYYLVEPARKLPADAILIGRYDAPIHESEFISDLVHIAAPLPEPAPDACRGICAGPATPRNGEAPATLATNRFRATSSQQVGASP